MAEWSKREADLLLRIANLWEGELPRAATIPGTYRDGWADAIEALRRGAREIRALDPEPVAKEPPDTSWVTTETIRNPGPNPYAVAALGLGFLAAMVWIVVLVTS